MINPDIANIADYVPRTSWLRTQTELKKARTLAGVRGNTIESLIALVEDLKPHVPASNKAMLRRIELEIKAAEKGQ